MTIRDIDRYRGGNERDWESSRDQESRDFDRDLDWETSRGRETNQRYISQFLITLKFYIYISEKVL